MRIFALQHKLGIKQGAQTPAAAAARNTSSKHQNVRRRWRRHPDPYRPYPCCRLATGAQLAAAGPQPSRMPRSATGANAAARLAASSRRHSGCADLKQARGNAVVRGAVEIAAAGAPDTGAGFSSARTVAGPPSQATAATAINRVLRVTEYPSVAGAVELQARMASRNSGVISVGEVCLVRWDTGT